MTFKRTGIPALQYISLAHPDLLEILVEVAIKYDFINNDPSCFGGLWPSAGYHLAGVVRLVAGYAIPRQNEVMDTILTIPCLH